MQTPDCVYEAARRVSWFSRSSKVPRRSGIGGKSSAGHAIASDSAARREAAGSTDLLGIGGTSVAAGRWLQRIISRRSHATCVADGNVWAGEAERMTTFVVSARPEYARS